MDRASEEASENKQRLAAMGLSVSVSVLLMVLKFYSFWLTGSAAILSDALESIINVVAGGFALWSVMLASKPPDIDHPYGHGEVEFFSVGFEGALIVLTAGGILWQAIPKIMEPQPLPQLEIGLFILLGTALVNLWLGRTLIRVGNRTNSFAISADGKHILTDVYTSAGVLIGLFLVRQTGWYFLDGTVACLVAVNILFIGFRLVFKSVAQLMHAYDPELLDRITEVIEEHRKPEWIDVHHLRAWRSGRQIYIDFHLILPRELSLEQAHGEVMEIGQLLKSHLPGMVDALIHAEPCIGPECSICSRVLCDIRSRAFFEQPSWCRKKVAYPAGVEDKLKIGRWTKSRRKFTRAGPGRRPAESRE